MDNPENSKVFITNELVSFLEANDIANLHAKSLGIAEDDLVNILEIRKFTQGESPIDAEPYPIDEMINHIIALKDKGATHVAIEYSIECFHDSGYSDNGYSFSGHKYTPSTATEILEHLGDKAKQRESFLHIHVKKMEGDLIKAKAELEELRNARK